MAVVVAAKWLTFGFRCYFCIKVSCWCCGGSSYICRHHMPDAYFVLLSVNDGFAWLGASLSTSNNANLLRLVTLYLVHIYVGRNELYLF